MAFTNLPIDLQDLPNAGALELSRLPPEHGREVRTQCLLVVAPLVLAACVPMLFVLDKPVVLRILAALAVHALLVGALVSSLVIRRAATKGYALREHDVAFEVGLYWRKRVVLPINRVQHVEVSSGPLQRRFGLASLKFFTAGGASVDLNIDGLLAGDAERLRDVILDRVAGVQQR